MDPSRVLVAGAADEYSFGISFPDGTSITVEMYWDPPPIDEFERDAIRAALTRWARRIDPAWTWDIPPIPRSWPAFQGFVIAESGEIWVLRLIGARQIPECTENPSLFEDCWWPETAYDVFGADGRFLGSVPTPPGFLAHLTPYINGDLFVGVVQDEAGTQYVRAYQLAIGK